MRFHEERSCKRSARRVGKALPNFKSIGQPDFFKDMEKNFRFAIREKMLPLKKLVTTYVNIQPVFFGGNKIKSEVGCPMLF